MPFRFKARFGQGQNRQRLPRGATIAFISILVVVVVGYDLYQTWEGRSREIEDSRREVANLGWSAAQHAEIAFRSADASLIALVERVEVDGTAPEELERLRRLMAQQMASLPMLQGLTVFDETGASVVHGAPVTTETNAADRAYFQYHRTHSDRQPYTGESLRSRASGKWVANRPGQVLWARPQDRIFVKTLPPAARTAVAWISSSVVSSIGRYLDNAIISAACPKGLTRNIVAPARDDRRWARSESSKVSITIGVCS